MQPGPLKNIGAPCILLLCLSVSCRQCRRGASTLRSPCVREPRAVPVCVRVRVRRNVSKCVRTLGSICSGSIPTLMHESIMHPQKGSPNAGPCSTGSGRSGLRVAAQQPSCRRASNLRSCSASPACPPRPPHDHSPHAVWPISARPFHQAPHAFHDHPPHTCPATKKANPHMAPLRACSG